MRKRHVVLVTGSCGFIGTNLTKRLLEEGCVVIGLDRAGAGRRFEGYRYATGLGMDLGNYELLEIKGDIRDQGLLRELFLYPIDYVVHLAALSTIQMGAESAGETMSVNVGGTEGLLRAVEACRTVKGVIYASTDKVYGRLQAPAYTEDMPLEPLDSPYDRSKAAADRMVREWAKEHGGHGIVLRFCNIYGKYDLQATRIIPGTLRALTEGQDCVLRVYRDESQKIQNFQRDFLYVEDLCGAVCNMIGKLEDWNAEESGMWGEAFNLGAGQSYSMDQVILKLQKILGKKRDVRVETVDMIPEIPRQCMDFSKARRVFGFAPETPLEEGLKQTAQWWLEQGREVRI